MYIYWSEKLLICFIGIDEFTFNWNMKMRLKHLNLSAAKNQTIIELKQRAMFVYR